MAAQPPSYGIAAGRRLDADGEPDENFKLEHTVPEDTWKTAAVLVPVLAREPEASVLFTLRTPSSLSPPIAGKSRFRAANSRRGIGTPVTTAIREAEEEVGVPPALVTPLSLLDLHDTGTGFRIVPVLALVDPGFEPAAHPGEVAEVFEVPLSFLMAEQNHLRHLATYNGRKILFHAMQYKQRFIWGATAAILRNLYERLYRQGES